MEKVNEFMKNCEKLLGKEVRITLKNGVNLYGVLDEYIPTGKLGNPEDEIYIKSKGNIMGILRNRIDVIIENV